jgi:hypothetical protein
VEIGFFAARPRPGATADDVPKSAWRALTIPLNAALTNPLIQTPTNSSFKKELFT